MFKPEGLKSRVGRRKVIPAIFAGALLASQPSFGAEEKQPLSQEEIKRKIKNCEIRGHENGRGGVYYFDCDELSPYALLGFLGETGLRPTSHTSIEKDGSTKGILVTTEEVKNTSQASHR